MEKEGLRRSLDLLRAHGVTFDSIVTDRHLKYKNTCGRPTSHSITMYGTLKKVLAPVWVCVVYVPNDCHSLTQWLLIK